MACKYVYNGEEYSKEELLDILKRDNALNNMSMVELRSITTKPKTSDIISKSVTVLQQRKSDAINMKKTIKNSNASKEEKIKDIYKYDQIIEQANEAINNLKIVTPSKKLNLILTTAENDIKIVDAAFKSNNLNIRDFRIILDIVDTWSSINNLLGIETTENVSDEKEIIQDLEGNKIEIASPKKRLDKIKSTYLQYSEECRKVALTLIENSTKGVKVERINLLQIVDTSILTEYLRELSTAGIPITNKLSYIINEVNLIINKEHNKNHTEIDEKFELIKNNSTFKRMGWDLFIKSQKNKKGEESLGVVTRYNQKFWDVFREVNKNKTKDLLNAGEDKAKIKAAYEKFNKWKDKYTVTFNALYFLDNAKYSDVQRQREIDRIKAMGFNESEINNMIAESKRKYDSYLWNKDMYRYRVEQNAINDPSVIPTGKTIDDYVKSKVEEYDDINNPLKYYDQKFFGTQIFTAYGATKYLYLIPLKIVDGKNTDFYDENFIKISQDPKLQEFYSWYMNFMKDQIGYLPEEESDTLGSNFLPVTADRLAKEYGFTGLKESINGVGDWFLKALTSYNFDNKIEVNPVTNKQRMTIKTRFLKENVDVKDRSKNLVVIAKMFSDMATMYKHRSMVKSEIDTINDVLQSTKGSYKVNKKTGEREAQYEDAKRIKSLAASTIAASFYGIVPEDTLPVSSKKFYDWKELVSFGGWKSEKADKAKKLEDAIRKLNEELDSDTLSDEDREKKEDQVYILKGEYMKLGGRSLSTTSVIESLITQTRLGALALKPFAAARNLLVGKINNYNHAAGELDFNKKELAKANRTIIDCSKNYFSAGKIETKNTKKILRMLIDAGIAEGEFGAYIKELIDKKTIIDRVNEILPKAYTLLSSGDYHFKAEMTVACAYHDKIKTSTGKEISFYDALTENGEYNEKEYGAWDSAANDNLTFDEYYNKKLLKYKQLANKLHGLSGKNTYIKAKDNAIGKLLILFKSWLPETVGVRFDPKHKDDQLGRYEEGYYRTFGKILLEKKAGILKMMLDAVLNRQITGLTDEMQLANFKKAVSELKVIVALYLAYMLLKAMAPDDDRYKKMYNLLVLRQLNDLNRDLTYYSNIASASELQKEIFPVVRTIRNWGETGKAITYYGMQIEKEDGELEYDGERTALKITKVLPVLSNINQVIYYQKKLN
jgi:hypothetical protein